MRTIVPLYWPVPVDRLAITLANTMGWDGLAQKVGPAKKLDSFETALRLHWAAAAAPKSTSTSKSKSQSQVPKVFEIEACEPRGDCLLNEQQQQQLKNGTTTTTKA
ncbi:hypothetical protein ACLKA6_016553 [Drosophila palustris]